MTDADREGFATLMLGLGETYGEPVSEARMEIYFAALSDLDPEEIQAAATAHVRTQKFFPRPSELREAVDGSADDRAEFAWAAVLRLVRRVGFWSEPADDDWPDAAVQRAALEMYGGWKALCAKLPGEGPEFLGAAKLFKAAYQANYRRAVLTLPPSRDEARARLRNVKAELVSRGLPTGQL